MLIGSFGSGLSTDMALDRWASLLNLERGMDDIAGCPVDAALPWALARLLAASAIRAMSVMTVESLSILSLSS